MDLLQNRHLAKAMEMKSWSDAQWLHIRPSRTDPGVCHKFELLLSGKYIQCLMAQRGLGSCPFPVLFSRASQVGSVLASRRKVLVCGASVHNIDKNAKRVPRSGKRQTKSRNRGTLHPTPRASDTN